jgi:hypothetical protein
MATFRAVFQAHVDGLTVGTLSESVPLTIQWSSTSATYEVDQVTFAGGNNTLTPPNVNTKLLILVPPAGSTIGLTFKGVGGDTGAQMSPFNTMIFPLSGTGAAVVVNAVSPVTCQVIWL